jgi:hypothetical protein
VHRNTLGRWLTTPIFIEELRSFEGQMREASRARMFALTDRAANCIEHAIDRGDARLALQLLKTLNVHQLDSRPLTESPRQQLDWLGEMAEEEDASNDSYDGKSRESAQSSPANDEAHSAKFGPPATTLDKAEADQPNRTVDAAQVRLATSRTGGSPSTADRSEEKHGDRPSPGESAEGLFTLLKVHCFALLCTIAAFFRQFSRLLGGRAPKLRRKSEGWSSASKSQFHGREQGLLQRVGYIAFRAAALPSNLCFALLLLVFCELPRWRGLYPPLTGATILASS